MQDASDRRRGRALPPFERRRSPLLPLPAFLRRVAFNVSLGLLLIGVSLLCGMAGYEHFEGMDTPDAFLNASMILSGMGPAAVLRTDAGKWFAGFYALYSGITVIAAAGLVLAPLLHRLLHHFHADEADFTCFDDEPAPDSPRKPHR